MIIFGQLMFCNTAAEVTALFYISVKISMVLRSYFAFFFAGNQKLCRLVEKYVCN